MARHELWIPKWRPTRLNVLLYRNRWMRSKMKGADKTTIALYAREQAILKASSKRRVTLHITLSGRMQEADIDAYQKTILDALVSAGLLLGDHSCWAEWAGVNYSRGVDWGTRIILEDLP